MRVLTDGGRTLELDPDDVNDGDTVGALAGVLAGGPHEGRRFSLKVNGHVTHPDARMSDVAGYDDAVLELIEVTDHDWSKVGAATGEERTGVEVPLGQTGTVAGTVDEVIAWVGDDVARAAEALDAERQSDRPRTTLIEALEQIVG